MLLRMRRGTPRRYDRPGWQSGKSFPHRCFGVKVSAPKRGARSKATGRQHKSVAGLVFCPSILVLVVRRDLVVNFRGKFQVLIYIATVGILRILADWKI